MSQEEVSIQCPYCASAFSILVDPTGGQRQSFTTDCEVCCRPIVVSVEGGDDGELQIDIERES